MKCINCGREPLASTDIVVCVNEKNETLVFCKKCESLFGTCAMCQHNVPCGFFNDPDPMPQTIVVARRIQQGNATFIQQQQIPNKERIKKFCINTKCPCYNGDEEHPLCCRVGGCTTCTNYCELEQNKFV